MPSRRKFLQRSLLGLGAFPFVVGCEATAILGRNKTKIPHVGYLGVATPDAASRNLSAFRAGLAELGYVEGQTIALDPRYGEGQAEALPSLAMELVALPVDVILTDGNAGINPARQVTSKVPIVFAIADDPVADGIVTSMARPGGNLTGLTSQSGQEEAKRLQLLHDIVPELSKVAVLWHRVAIGRFRQIQEAASVMGISVQSLELANPDDFDATMENAITEHPDGLMVIGAGGIFGGIVDRIVAFAIQARLPSISTAPAFARAGGLIGFGANSPDLYRRAATYVDKILKGSDPADLPVERPTKFDFVLNLKTAQVLGRSIPQSVQAQVTEIIQ
jgi:ABC-type uncharacterized transport system substrate-binding protein